VWHSPRYNPGAGCFIAQYLRQRFSQKLPPAGAEPDAFLRAIAALQVPDNCAWCCIMHHRRVSRSPIALLQNFCASASQAVRTAALRSLGVAARAASGAIKAMTMAIFRNAIIVFITFSLNWIAKITVAPNDCSG
jgi:hypothetical protein